jgi:hypothetical protein
MAQVWPLALLVAGVLLVASGALLLSRSTRSLQRAGAFRSVYWASFRRFAGYRLRALRPLRGALVGAVMVAVGLAALYVGIEGFYAARLGGLSG